MHKQTVLLLGSGPNVVEAVDWPRKPFDSIVAINNAWRVRTDWNYLIYPEDFPEGRRPETVRANQRHVIHKDFVPAQNRFGGFVFAGGTMAFTAAYWALSALSPRVMAFMGCDMVYPKGDQTHFYGTGSADPLRKDVTLQSLEAKAARLMVLAAEMGCTCVNLSSDESRLVFPRETPLGLTISEPELPVFDRDSVMALLAEEADLGYFVPSGRYWEVADRFDARRLAEIDDAWLELAATAEQLMVPRQVLTQLTVN